MNILSEIIKIKKNIVEEKKKKLPLKKILESIEKTKNLSIYESLKNHFGLIAELKRGSPSLGLINNNLDFKKISIIYQKCGVSGISVLTCEPYFLGSIEDLKTVKEVVTLPILMKDFIIDEYQIYEGKYYGADFVLLIVRILEDQKIKKFIKICEKISIEVLIEIFNIEDLKRIFKIVENWENKILGINNRDLKTLKTDINNTLNLIKHIPIDKIIVISESGIKEKEEILLLKNLGVKGVLVGESILKSKNIEQKIKELKN
ncbi:MAG: indole-3-glycerol phosphate synthase TrpC [Candidatus Omnitrophica bacterium]|nr:indole-3-glycerol phosphate synthase TrpC [Candidatus Omnitrophota bacterium]MCM8809102.1 indole-3-glycerol phosphate synthase TrpC [Candidatus Omnitrophota bacterium]